MHHTQLTCIWWLLSAHQYNHYSECQVNILQRALMQYCTHAVHWSCKWLAMELPIISCWLLSYYLLISPMNILVAHRWSFLGRQPKHTILSYNCALKVLSRFTSKRNSDPNLIELCTNPSSQNGNLDYQDSTLLHNARQVSITSKITQSVCKRCQTEPLHFLYLHHVCNPCIYQYYHLT